MVIPARSLGCAREVTEAPHAVLLVVPDGAADAPGEGQSCLSEARTPALDALVATGELRRVRTIPRGLAAGTEVGLPGLLGAKLSRAPSRGRVEAAAAGVSLGYSEGAWRLDLMAPTGRPCDLGVHADTADRLSAALAGFGARVYPLRGHRLLLVGPARWGDAPRGPHQGGRWPINDPGPFGALTQAAAAAVRPGQRPWPWGALGAADDLMGTMDESCTVVTPGGAAAGIAAASGCRVVQAAGSRAWVEVAQALRRCAVVVLHDDRPDEAAHARDRQRKVAAIERLDAGLAEHLPLLERVHLVLCPDHGCDPATGEHTAEAVPALVRPPGPSLPSAPQQRLTERSVAALAEEPAHGLLCGLRTSVAGRFDRREWVA